MGSPSKLRGQIGPDGVLSNGSISTKPATSTTLGSASHKNGGESACKTRAYGKRLKHGGNGDGTVQ